MDDHGQIKIRLKEAGIYLQFLNEDIDSVESIREKRAFQIDQLLREVTKRLRKSVHLLTLERKGKGRRTRDQR
jgi:hypothetical protein